VGSYSLAFVTRDTHGSAQKATYIEVNGIGIEIFKDPITDGGVKKSAKGLLQVYKDENNKICLKDQCTWEEEGKGLLQVIFEDGKFYNETTLTRIREKLNN
jgi:nicotinamide phosphoribosyltransferase